MGGPAELADHLFRRQAGQMVSTLTRIFGPRHIALAEDVVQDALVKALQQWRIRGVPANPGAWLIQVAKNRALDLLRRDAALAAKAPEIARAFTAVSRAEEMDDQLAMMFLCCHPAIPREQRIALTLKTVGGFGAGEIARAFLIREPTAAQRVVRAKRLIREQRFELPAPRELAGRLDSVLETLYLMFNEGYSSGGEQLLRHDLCEESIRLARMVADHPATGTPPSHALLALMFLQTARSAARVDEQGELLLLCDQDRSLWDQARVSQGLSRLAQSAEGDRMTEYHLQAGIAAAHATAPGFASTDWVHIAALYDQLYAINPSPVIALNRAVAVLWAEGAARGLAELAQVEHHPALQHYYLLHATLGHLWMDRGDGAQAVRCFECALGCECSVPERRFLEKQLTAAGG